MIKELIPLLATHKLKLDIELDGDDLWVYVFPECSVEVKKKAPAGTTHTKDYIPEKSKAVLEQRYMKRYNKNEFTNDELVRDINTYTNVMVEGTTNIVKIAEQFKLEAEAMEAEQKKANAAKQKPANTTRKPAPKRKTKAQKEAEEREAARAKQAEERKNEKQPEEEPNRLDPKPMSDEQALHESTGGRTPEPESKTDDNDPLGLGLGSIDI